MLEVMLVGAGHVDQQLTKTAKLQRTRKAVFIEKKKKQKNKLETMHAIERLFAEFILVFNMYLNTLCSLSGMGQLLIKQVKRKTNFSLSACCLSLCCFKYKLFSTNNHLFTFWSCFVSNKMIFTFH